MGALNTFSFHFRSSFRIKQRFIGVVRPLVLTPCWSWKTLIDSSLRFRCMIEVVEDNFSCLRGRGKLASVSELCLFLKNMGLALSFLPFSHKWFPKSNVCSRRWQQNNHTSPFQTFQTFPFNNKLLLHNSKKENPRVHLQSLSWFLALWSMPQMTNLVTSQEH